MLKRFVTIGFIVGAVAFAPRAEAATLVGALSISSVSGCGGCNSVLPEAGGVQVALGSATGFDFTNTGALTPGVAGTFHVDNSSGDFLSLFNTTGSIGDFTFSGAGTASYPAPTVFTWQAGTSGFSFDITSVTVVAQNDSAVTLAGLGTFHMSGFDPTVGTFNFQSNQAGGVFSFAGSEATVPEPGSMMLLGTGLIGIGSSLRRRWAARKA